MSEAVILSTTVTSGQVGVPGATPGVTLARWALAARRLPAGVAPSGPAFSIVLLLHIASAVVGFGAMVFTGVQGARLGRGPDAKTAASLARYFRPGTNWAARMVYLVPVFGLTLVAMSRGAFDLRDTFVITGLSIWLASVVVAELVLWPGERRIQRALSTGWPAEVDRELERACRQVAWTAPVLAVAFVGAASVMVLKP